METKIGHLFSDTRFSSSHSGSVLLDEANVTTTMNTYIENNSIEYDKKFTQTFLEANDFYTIDDNGPVILRFNNQKLYYAGFSGLKVNGSITIGDGYDGVFNQDSPFNEYTLENGIITVTVNGDDTTYTILITKVTDISISTFQKNIDTAETRTREWYTDKDTAQAYLDTL
ncbi:hypothetical protein [Sulfurimonas sp.]|jgi:hypothetical protein|uniref:hypothetical protein n=1 Tax=Sulfurimonas sp. TaxID=2022749 RepID=UPI002601563C|nr:hypothetical protein [Sulfurimonas sp.]MBT5935886.1 hypothetical protein [Sulfurimonas sp.]